MRYLPVFSRNRSLASGTLPKDWLRANVIPLYKKGDIIKTKAENYRPVSLTCLCCKMLEHIIYSSIMKHADKYKILTRLQHGFRKGHSCETQVLLTAHDLARAHDNKEQIDMIVLDFSKAFDKVPPERLLAKLDHYGIRGNTLAWIRSFLTMRSQEVLLEGSRSKPSHVVSGVPQGTVLGPLLFLLYINDLPDGLSSNVRLFADDCVLYRTVRDHHDTKMLQNDLNVLQDWERNWLMHFNPSKCNLMRFTTKRKIVKGDYFIHGTKLAQTDTHKYLGVWFSKDFKWNHHIDSMVQRANKMLGFVKRTIYGLPKKFKETSYKSLVRPHVEY